MGGESEQVYSLACLELHGGNHLAAYRAELPGLEGWVSCRPLHPSPRGGDLYYLSACSQGVIARVALAGEFPVCHGVPGQFLLRVRGAAIHQCRPFAPAMVSCRHTGVEPHVRFHAL